MFLAKRNQLATAIEEYLENRSEGETEENLVKGVWSLIDTTQTRMKFVQFVVTDSSPSNPNSYPNRKICFPNDCLSDADLLYEADTLPDRDGREKIVFSSDSEFLEYLQIEYKPVEIILSNDAVEDMFAKHMHNTQLLTTIYLSDIEKVRDRAHTKRRLLERIEPRLEQAVSASNERAIAKEMKKKQRALLEIAEAKAAAEKFDVAQKRLALFRSAEIEKHQSVKRKYDDKLKELNLKFNSFKILKMYFPFLFF
jgi:hypothetical protein